MRGSRMLPPALPMPLPWHAWRLAGATRQPHAQHLHPETANEPFSSPPSGCRACAWPPTRLRGPPRLTVEPTWRTMMPPAFTGCPPYTLTPRRLLSESRPFLVEPAPFLCAASMKHTLRRAGAHGASAARRWRPARDVCIATCDTTGRTAVQWAVLSNDRSLRRGGASPSSSLEELKQQSGLGLS